MIEEPELDLGWDDLTHYDPAWDYAPWGYEEGDCE